jgi:hypothetical protein
MAGAADVTLRAVSDPSGSRERTAAPHGVGPPEAGGVVLGGGGAGCDVTADVGGLDGGVVGAGVLDRAGAVDDGALGCWLGGGAVVARPLDPTGAEGGCALNGWLADTADDEPLADAAMGGHHRGVSVWAASVPERCAPMRTGGRPLGGGVMPGRVGAGAGSGGVARVGVAPGELVATATGPRPAGGAAASRSGDPPTRTAMTTIAAAAAVATPAVVTTRRRAGSAAMSFRSGTSAMGRTVGRGLNSTPGRQGRVPATRRTGRDLGRGRRASASATALCRAMRHRGALAGWLVVLRTTRPPRQLKRFAPGLYAPPAASRRPRRRPNPLRRRSRTDG